MSYPSGASAYQAGRRAAAAESLRLSAAEARDQLIDALAREGFRHREDAASVYDGWCGVVKFRPLGSDEDGPARTTVVEVTVPEQFPFRPPSVHPCSKSLAELVAGRTFGEDYYAASCGWHRDLDLAMCLFDEADYTRLRWVDGALLLEQVRAWLASDAAGWPDDAPALDLERYLSAAADHRVILYGPLDDLDGAVLRLQNKRHDLLRLGHAAGKTSYGGSRRRMWGRDAVLVLEAGELTAPIRQWDDLCAAVGSDRAERLTVARRNGLARVLIAYTRRGVRAALALELNTDPGGAVQLRAMRAAPDDMATRRIRAGERADSLGTRTVAVVGVGAIGSIVADLLHRGGVGHLQLIDADKMLPGNTTRHLLDDTTIGRAKSNAVADALKTARPNFGQVTFCVDRVDTPECAVELLAGADVVVDATADSTATALLTAAAQAGAGQLLSVSVLADGFSIRVDRTPPPDGETPLPAPCLPPLAPTVYEAGCGSPVSTTPPAAVWEAAAIAARHTVGLLTHPESVPAGEERRLRPEVGRR